MVRFIIRNPKILTTPKALSQAVGVRCRMAPSKSGRVRSYEKDFLMTYPPEGVVSRAPETYRMLSRFWNSPKHEQRAVIAAGGLKTPLTAAGGAALDGEGPFVVRPLRHQGGHGWRVTKVGSDYRAGHEYISAIFNKNAEYRLIYVYGSLVVMLRKIPNDGVQGDQPWNHGNSHFETVQDVATSNLAAHTDILDRLAGSEIIRHSHIVGVDVLYKIKKREYTIPEFNSSPGVTIPENIQKIAEAIKAHK